MPRSRLQDVASPDARDTFQGDQLPVRYEPSIFPRVTQVRSTIFSTRVVMGLSIAQMYSGTEDFHSNDQGQH